MSEYRPSLTAAIQVGKKTLTGRHHRDIYAAMTPEERALAGTDGRQFGFVDEAGKYLHRAPAMQYAREMGLLHPKHADTKSPHLISEMLADRPARKKGGGLYANIHAKQERIKHGSGEHMRKPGTGDAPSAQDFRDSARTARADGGGTVKRLRAATIYNGKVYENPEGHQRAYQTAQKEQGRDHWKTTQFMFKTESGKMLDRQAALEHALAHNMITDEARPHAEAAYMGKGTGFHGMGAQLPSEWLKPEHRAEGGGVWDADWELPDDILPAPKGKKPKKPEPLGMEHDDPRRAENLKAWFGNSVLHDDGVPRTYYTGTSKDKDFDKFNVGRHGAWFTSDPNEASKYAEENDSQDYRYEGGKYVKTNRAGRVIPAHLKAENPYTGDIPAHYHQENYKRAQSAWFDHLRAKGHDSWVPASSKGALAVMLHGPHQIKSAIGNSGEFSQTDHRVQKADGGWIADEPPSAEALANEARNFRFKNPHHTPEFQPTLPHDPTSREKRATQLGYVHHGFHGTRANVPAFDPRMVDVGTHIGTDEQANQRLNHTRKWNDDPTGENVIPVRAKLGKSFNMPDVGSWNDSAEVMQHLVSHGKRMNPEWKPSTHEVRALHEAAIDGRLDHQSAQETGGLDWHETPHNRFLLDNINKMLRDDGYGSIKYHNIAENAHGSTPGIRHDVQKRLEEMERELNAIYAADNSADPVGAKSRINDLQARMHDLQYDPSSKNDRHSYIVLDPAHLRSRFAQFDPARAHEPDLLAAKGGFMRKPRADGGAVSEDEKLHTGPIHSPVAGRTDHLPMHVPSGSYVIPADIIGAMGEGNTMAGFKHVRRMFAGNPYGNKPAPYDQGAKTPYATDPDTQPYDPSAGPYQSELPGKAHGGSAANHVAIVAAGGEYVLTPDEVRMAGDGDLERGHRVLDEFIKRYRQKTIKTLQKLPGPARD